MLSNCGVGEDSRVPWTAWRSNQSILKDTNPEYSLEGLMLKFQYFGHLMQRPDSLEKTLMLGKIEGKRRRGWQKVRWLNGMDMHIRKLQEMVKDREAWHAAVQRVTKSQTWLSNWTMNNRRKNSQAWEIASWLLMNSQILNLEHFVSQKCYFRILSISSLLNFFFFYFWLVLFWLFYFSL